MPFVFMGNCRTSISRDEGDREDVRWQDALKDIRETYSNNNCSVHSIILFISIKMADKYHPSYCQPKEDTLIHSLMWMPKIF